MFFRIIFIAILAVSAAHADVAKQGEVIVGAKESGERLLAPMHVDVKVSADGKVTAVRSDPNIPASISERLTKAVSQWKYSPAKRQGMPIDWATRVKVTLTAVPVEKGYALRVSKASAASVWISPAGWVPPQFPLEEMIKGRSAELALVVEPGIDGSPTVVQSIYVDGKSPSKRDLLAKASRVAVVKWKFEALEWDGVKYIESICVPVRFLANKGPPPAQAPDLICESIPEISNAQSLPISLESKPEGSMI